MAGENQNVLEWVQKDKRRMLHAVYRVGNLQKTIEYVILYLRFKIYLESDYCISGLFIWNLSWMIDLCIVVL